MMTVRALALASIALALGAGPVFGQELSRYRAYTLESSVAAVVAQSGARTSDTTTPYLRPALIQEVLWRAPYVRAEDGVADPVRDIVFSFVDDQLYRVKVTYDRERVEGLTNDDLVGSISETYGVPPLLQGRMVDRARTSDENVDTAVLAQWEDEASLLTLTRGTFRPQFQLTLTSKALNGRAEAAIKDAIALDSQERPQRELDARTKAAADALSATQKARVVNKAVFKP
jgi:hypothetical protein